MRTKRQETRTRIDEDDERIFMDLSLQQRLGELTATTEEIPLDLPMDLSAFWEKHFLPKGLCCKTSSYKTVLKWARSMDKQNLLLLKGQKGRKVSQGAFIVALGSADVAMFRGGKQRGGQLTTEALSLLEVDTLKLAPSTPLDSGSRARGKKVEEQSDGGEEDTDAASEFSFAPSVSSVATSAYSFVPTRHLKIRQAQRQIETREVQSVLKHHKGVVQRSRDGVKKIQANGVTVVKSHNRVLTAWWEEAVHISSSLMDSQWMELGMLAEDGEPPLCVVIESMIALPSYITRALPFLFPTSEMGVATAEEDVRKACDQYMKSLRGRDSMGEIGKILFLQHLQEDGHDLSESNHLRHLGFYSKWMLGILSVVMERRGELTSLNDAANEAVGKTLKAKGIKWPPKECLRLLITRDSNLLAPLDADYLMDLLMTLAIPCHVMSDSQAPKDGHPKYVTICIGTRRKGKGGHKARKKMHIRIVGMKRKQCELVLTELRRAVGCSCSIETFKGWNPADRKEIDPFAKENSPMISLCLGGGNENLTKIFKVVRKFVPQELRRSVYRHGATKTEAAPRLPPAGNMQGRQKEHDDEEEDPYEEQMRESARLRLQEIYKQHAPDKLRSVDFLLEKYSGKEQELVRSVEKKWAPSDP